ncbi:MAG: hypothetical protein KJO38_00105, partial [Gammaproteobacteria bacterium]|nr:hypothetical protein [Gammaproteobacteria bacterium]
GEPAAAVPGAETAEDTVARLKRVLDAWDRQRSADARAIVNQAPALADPPPASAVGPDATPGPPSVAR